MAESIHSLAALKRHIATLDRAPAVEASPRFTCGPAAMDAALGGGLAQGRVHEIFASVEEEGAAAGLALLWMRQAGRDAPLLWLRNATAVRVAGAPYGPGLAALGLDPQRLLIGMMADDAMLLRAAVDALRCPALGALLIDLRGPAPLLDLTASRRLALAAETSGVTALLLRIGGDPVPSAAETRWRVAAAPSAPLSGQAPGQSAFDITLLRRRAGPDGMTWRLYWDSNRGEFGDAADERHDDDDIRDAPLSGAAFSLPGAGPSAGRAA